MEPLLKLLIFGTCALITVKACSDKFSTCTVWKKSGYCTDNRYKKFMSQNCRKSCGLCGGGATTSPPVVKTRPVTSPGKCSDKNGGCAGWAARGFCTMDKHKAYMTMYCKKSCNLCARATTSPPVVKTSPPDASCKDKNSTCAYWKSLGYCKKDSVYHWFMTQNCKKTCNFCGGPITKPPVVTTRRPVVTTAAPSCKDDRSACAYWKGLGYCKKDSVYHWFMTQNCKKTCNFCSGSITNPPVVPTNPPATTRPPVVTTNPPVVTTGASCADKNSTCAYWKSLGYCKKDSVYHWFMTQNCKKTCNFCPGATTSPPVVTTRPPVVTTRPPVVTTADSCRDKNSACAGWAQKGYCKKDSKFHGWMIVHCKKSCNVCGGATTRPPVATTHPRPPIGTTAYSCIDKTSDCAGWARQGYCTKDSKYHGWMIVHCKKSCNVCGGATVRPPVGATHPRPPIATTAYSCIDKTNDCAGWARQGYCKKDSKYHGWMIVHCKKSCNVCGGATARPPVMTTHPRPPVMTTHPRPPVVTTHPRPPIVTTHPRPPIGTTAYSCIDKTSDCAGWARQGYCKKDSKYHGWMIVHCKKSCNVCGGAVVTTAGPIKTQPPVTGSCGQPDFNHGRVISGSNAPKGAWPWQVLIIYNTRPMCGGSLIAPNWVVTAAHCVSLRMPSVFRIRVGEHVISTTSDGQHEDIRVSRIIKHPRYSIFTKDSDIALIKLAKPVTNSKYVKPVCLPRQDQNVPVGTQCYVTGWGETSYPGDMHHTLQQAKMPVVSKSDCSKLNTENLRKRITDNMVCAGDGGKTKVSSCDGDRGGPFVCQTGANGRWVLHGAVSWGPGSCDATQGYSVFTRVAKFRSLIDQEMGRN